VSEQLTPLALRCRCDSLAGAGQAMHTLAHTQGGGPKAGFRLRWAAQNTTAGHQPAGRQHRGGVSLPSAQLEIQLWLQPPALVAALDQATGTSQPRLGAEACSYALLLTVRPAAAAAAATAACGHPHGAAAGFPRGHPGLRPTDPVSSDAHAVVEGEDCPERAKVGSAAAAAAAAEQHTHRLWQYSFNLSGHSAGHRPGEDASSGGGGGGGGGARHAAAAAGRERLLLTPPLPAALLELARQQPLSVSMQLVLTLPPTALSSSSAAGAASAVPLQGRLIHVFVFASSNISVSESRTCCNLFVQAEPFGCVVASSGGAWVHSGARVGAVLPLYVRVGAMPAQISGAAANGAFATEAAVPTMRLWRPLDAVHLLVSDVRACCVIYLLDAYGPATYFRKMF
jgi:hypothetical protein